MTETSRETAASVGSLDKDNPSILPQPLDPAALQREARGLRLFWLTAALCIVLDQISKAWVRAAIPYNGTVPLLPGWVHLTHVNNLGAAWGVLTGQRWLLVAVAVGVVAMVGSACRDVVRRGPLSGCGLGLILGGAIGNLLDRIVAGRVTDFIDLDTPVAYLRTFPVWNVADAALTVGAVCLILSFLLPSPQKHGGTEKE